MKQLSVIILMLLLGSSIGIASNVISIQTTKTKSGNTGTFAIIMKNDVSVNGLHFILQYEPDLITPIKITPIGRAASLTSSTASLSGDNKINFLVYDNSFTLAAIDSGNIFEIEYLVTDSLGDSMTTQLVFTEAMAADSGIMIIPFEFVNGEIGISPAVGVEETQANLPIIFELYQNFPNPFNPGTTIRFDLPKEANVSLKIYNILGQTVMTVIDEKRQAGRHAIQVDASSLSSGVYFYRLTADEYWATKKFVILK
jgi:hypothetical protein